MAAAATALLLRAAAGLVVLFAVLAAALFAAEGSIDDGRAWALLAVFFGCAGAITLWLSKRDPALLARRLRAGPGTEPDPVQGRVQRLAALVFLAIFVVPGLDPRFGWSHVPLWGSIAGDGAVALGFLLVFLTFRANSFAASTIGLAPGQHVVRRGPYALIRHPMYAGALVLVAGIGPALGAWWGMPAAAALAPILIWRLIREEAFLAANLHGYTAYRTEIRHRLVPWLW